VPGLRRRAGHAAGSLQSPSLARAQARLRLRARAAAAAAGGAPPADARAGPPRLAPAAPGGSGPDSGADAQVNAGKKAKLGDMAPAAEPHWLWLTFRDRALEARFVAAQAAQLSKARPPARLAC